MVQTRARASRNKSGTSSSAPQPGTISLLQKGQVGTGRRRRSNTTTSSARRSTPAGRTTTSGRGGRGGQGSGRGGRGPTRLAEIKEGTRPAESGEETPVENTEQTDEILKDGRMFLDGNEVTDPTMKTVLEAVVAESLETAAAESLEEDDRKPPAKPDGWAATEEQAEQELLGEPTYSTSSVGSGGNVDSSVDPATASDTHAKSPTAASLQRPAAAHATRDDATRYLDEKRILASLLGIPTVVCS